MLAHSKFRNPHPPSSSGTTTSPFRHTHLVLTRYLPDSSNLRFPSPLWIPQEDAASICGIRDIFVGLNKVRLHILLRTGSLTILADYTDYPHPSTTVAHPPFLPRHVFPSPSGRFWVSGKNIARTAWLRKHCVQPAASYMRSYRWEIYIKIYFYLWPLQCMPCM